MMRKLICLILMAAILAITGCSNKLFGNVETEFRKYKVTEDGKVETLTERYVISSKGDANTKFSETTKDGKAVTFSADLRGKPSWLDRLLAVMFGKTNIELSP